MAERSGEDCQISEAESETGQQERGWGGVTGQQPMQGACINSSSPTVQPRKEQEEYEEKSPGQEMCQQLKRLSESRKYSLLLDGEHKTVKGRKLSGRTAVIIQF